MRPDGGSLERLQRRFWALVTAPEGVAKALPSLAAADPDAAPLERWIAPPPDGGPGAAVARLDVHADMYFYRLLAILRDDYPKVLAVAGDAAFHNLATDYLLAHPSTDPSVRHVGRNLAGFLRGHPLAARHPVLPDLAALEWTRLAAFDAADAPAMADAVLHALAPHLWAGLPVRLVPSARLLALTSNAPEVWLALERGEAPAAPAPGTGRLLVWRDGFTVLHRAVDEAEWEELSLAGTGVELGAFCEALAARVGVEAAAPHALARLTSWVAQRLLVHPDLAAP